MAGSSPARSSSRATGTGDAVKHVLTLGEIATACSEYVVRKRYPGLIIDAQTKILTRKLEGIETAYKEGVILSISVEMEEPK